MTTETQKKNASAQEFLPIKEIKEGVAIMKDGSLRVAILASSINFALKSDQEKDSIIFAYQSFLNSLHHPIQIVTRSRQLHLDDYLEKLTKIYEKETNQLLKAEISEYVGFIAELLESANVMEKRFFIIVPYFGVNLEKTGPLKGLLGNKTPVTTGFESQKVELMERVDQILAGLTSFGLRCVVLNTEELIELYYDVYNPDISATQKISDVDELEAPIISAGDIPPGKGKMNV